jgi:hypothetical protein
VSEIIGRRRQIRILGESAEFRVHTQAPNHMIQSGDLHVRGEEKMIERFVQRVKSHRGPWLDDLRRRPVEILAPYDLAVDLIVDRSGQILVQDLVAKERWFVDYQCIRPISDMEAIARASEEA